MPGAQERILRRQIASVQNTKKITRAMELIAATRVVKAQNAANEARPYSERITQVIQDLSAAGAEVDHPLLRPVDEVKKVGVVVLAADRGLAGAYNTTVIRAAEREVQAARAEGKEFALVTVGRKAEGYFKFRNYPIEAVYGGFTDRPTYDEAVAIAARVTDLFVNGGCDRIDLVYTRFISLGTQEVVVRRFLPLEDAEHHRRGRRGRSHRRIRVRAVGQRGARVAAAPLRRVPPVRRAARGGRLGARLSSAGHEVGDRQRRRN